MKEKTTMIIAGFLALVLAQPAFAQEVKLEKIEWTDIWVMNAKETENPRVLLVGDSIVKGYYGAVEQGLSGQAACARYATSLFLSNPDYLAELTMLIKRYDFDVIHINNGLHGWDYSEEEYRQGLYSLLALMEREAPRAKIVWAMTTPVRSSQDLSQLDAAQNDRVIERNRIAAEIMGAKGIPVNDLYGVVQNHPEYFAKDGVHFNETGQAAQAAQVAEYVKRVLGG